MTRIFEEIKKDAGKATPAARLENTHYERFKQKTCNLLKDLSPSELSELAQLCWVERNKYSEDSSGMACRSQLMEATDLAIFRLGHSNTVEARVSLENLAVVFHGQGPTTMAITAARQHQIEYSIEKIKGVIGKFNLEGGPVWVSNLERVTKLPFDSPFVPFFPHEQRQLCQIIERIGADKTASAKTCLDEIKPMVTGFKTLEASWEKAKKCQLQ
ncbi:MAG: hypothetical protein JSS83_17890 [Cyanobacteria bacterium SZAS LIN-3]|nr:hypothetical protein [Cyanobacteria bacterium SZAS LIN-3]